jgi:hypothetical protein
VVVDTAKYRTIGAIMNPKIDELLADLQVRKDRIASLKRENIELIELFADKSPAHVTVMCRRNQAHIDELQNGIKKKLQELEALIDGDGERPSGGTFDAAFSTEFK